MHDLWVSRSLMWITCTPSCCANSPYVVNFFWYVLLIISNPSLAQTETFPGLHPMAIIALKFLTLNELFNFSIALNFTFSGISGSLTSMPADGPGPGSGSVLQ